MHFDRLTDFEQSAVRRQASIEVDDRFFSGTDIRQPRQEEERPALEAQVREEMAADRDCVHAAVVEYRAHLNATIGIGTQGPSHFSRMPRPGQVS